MGNQIHIFLRLIFAPHTLKPEKTFRQNSKKLRIGLLGGLGLCAQIAWVIPKNFISTDANYIIETLVNIAAAFILGFLFLIFMFVLENLFLLILGFKGTNGLVRGTQAIWIFLPLIAIPIHAIFPNGLAATGVGEIFWILLPMIGKKKTKTLRET